MKHLAKPFIQDPNGLFYINSEDVNIEEFSFNEITNSYRKRRKFYYIDGIEDYVIKDTSKLPLLFNGTRTKMILKNFQINQDKFNDVDFPVAYFVDKTKIVGTVVPFYKGAKSIKELTNLYSFSDLKKYYNHEDDEEENLIEMCLDILKIIKHLYDEDIVYRDISSGNFVVYNNDVKIIDFEPEYVHFIKNKKKYHDILLSNYNILVNYILRHYKFNDLEYYNPGENFYEAEVRVKHLIKEIKAWNLKEK